MIRTKVWIRGAVARLVAAVLIVGCGVLSSLVSTSTAAAEPVQGPSGRWCPGEPEVMSGYPPHPKVWRTDVCHDWYGIWNAGNGTWTVVEGTPPYT